MHLDATYLKWLYTSNPSGNLLGYDAWQSGRLAAHYACVPVEARVAGQLVQLLLSLNTATHPDFQGKGLFVRLAEATYEAAAARGFAGAYGVANAHSTPGFLRKLGFTLIAPLDAQLGIGHLQEAAPEIVAEHADFQRVWSPEALAWRVANPARPYSIVRAAEGWIGAHAATNRIGVRAWAQVPQPAMAIRAPTKRFGALLRLHLGLIPEGARRHSGAWFAVPQRMRASPLNMIYRAFDQNVAVPATGRIAFGNLDFDAF